ncbi:MAG TPA: Ig-like domain-containing protein [Candidatus Limnocylindrales bacterium]
MSGPTARRGSSIGRRRGAAALVLVASAAIVVGVLATGGPTGPSASLSTSHGTPGVTATTPGVATASPARPDATLPPDAAWSKLEIAAPFAAVADLRADRADQAGVQLDTSFTLTSRSGADPRALATRLETEPPIDLAIVDAAGSGSVGLRPTDRLAAGRIYRFTLRAEDGTVAGSWAFQARAPLHVVSLLPGNATTGVPVRTGIEVTFDQDAAADMARFFTISPAVDGRFERRGRTQVFVPTGLRAATLYTVRIRHGLPLSGTELSLERDVTFRFETAGPDQAPAVRFRFGRAVIEASPTDRPIVALVVDTPDSVATIKPPKSVEVRVYRFPSLAATVGPMQRFLAGPGWADFSDPSIPTTGLPRVMTFNAPLPALPGVADQIITFPARLPRGWYLVEAGTARPGQAILQVTEVSAWVAVLTDRTVAWVNNTATGGAIPGAAVRLVGGGSLGRTGSDGLLDAPTPADLVPPESDPAAVPMTQDAAQSPILVVEARNGHALLVPFDVDGQGGVYRGEWGKDAPSVRSAWWSVIGTDRSVYRRDDQIAAWGFLRGRIDGRVPTSVELRLVLLANAGQTDAPAVVRVTTRPASSGAYAAKLVLAGVAVGSYYLEAVVDGRVASAIWLDVGIIHKPAYRLTVTTDRHVVVAGDRVNATVTASFFDGQPVPGTPLAIQADTDEETVLDTVSTDRDGQATTRWTAPIPYPEGPESVRLSAVPARPEEGDIRADAPVAVFPSAVTLTATGTLTGRHLVVTGSDHAVDLTRLERELTTVPKPDISSLDPNGKPIVGATVTAEITELIPIRRLVGYDYDPITKLVVPRYEYDTQRKALRTLSLKTHSGGAFRLTLTVPVATHDYQVILRTHDGAGRIAQSSVMASRALAAEPSREPVFENAGKAGGQDLVYRIGDPIRLTMTDGVRPLPTGRTNRYFYLVSRQGRRSAFVTTTPRFSRTFSSADAPGIFIIGVHFNGRTYEPKAAAWATFDTRQRSLTVELSSARPSYRPGETVTLTVRTRDATGRPTPATVTVRAVDEKLFSMGAAQVADPLGSLYQRVESGIVRLTATHQLPIGGTEGEGGSTGGGGGDVTQARDDFRDTAVFRQLETNAHGDATVTFQLPDDLTAWHVSASAMTASLQAGEGQLMLPVGLPFFVDATIADEYLASDRPVIRLRAYGTSLRSGDPISFNVAGPSLGLASTVVDGTAFRDVSIPLPQLSVGVHKITIGASATTPGGAALADRLIRTITVVRSRTAQTRTAFDTVTANLSVPGGPDITTYTFSDAGRGRFVAALTELATSSGPRIDQAVAAATARDLLIADFGFDPALLPPDAFDPATYEVHQQTNDADEVIAAGLPLLPYGGPDARLTARVALVAADRFDRGSVRDALNTVRNLPSTTRDLRIAVLAGLAGLDEPVLSDLRTAAAATDLSVSERIDLALGFVAAGDDAAALAIERDLLRTDGQRFGSWTRLHVGTTLDETVGATAGLALVAAGIGDPIAVSLAAYVDANPARDELHVLDQIGVIERLLLRTPAAPASFAWTVDGNRSVVDLGPGRAFTVALTAAQRATLRLEPLTGQVGIAASWAEPVDLTTLTSDPALGLTRTITPVGTIGPDSLVVVELMPTFAGQAILGGYEVVDFVPSGLAPVARTDGWVGTDGANGPYRIVGQEVDFSVDNVANPLRVPRLRYLARIVTPGDYAWEPASMRLAVAPEDAAFTAPTRVTVADR